ncbi:ABC transporter ATP-binding protein [Stenotrophomonas maltophilia]|nr:ABC transporter ATP-binding protein [Stenotrophomonas maltophilia]MBA0275244.1 ABC transporter ATP-binding protein [Stenotrophomonas maltophilia]MBA0411054.1 ABC transporter ATP-binding protein [Stenotrophomonas maltophilia]MBA0496622.1 ABC transporter ATP-binding protein [Stenotrophomonas maltophilia]MBA0501107.1 ABC transporter ATP-binding protein [Stenotrophomonas maltophilia]
MMKNAVPPPVAEILGAYWKTDRRLLLLIAGSVALSSLASVAAPYLFSRLIDRLPSDGVDALAGGFLLYAVMLGAGSVLQNTVQYLSFLSGENLGFITSTRYFARLLKKTNSFFLDHNAAELQVAGEKGRGALKIVVQLGLVAFIPSALQIVLTLVTLGALINLQVVLIVLVYGTVAVTVSAIATRRARIHREAAVEAGQQNARFVGNAMNAMETLRQFGGSTWMVQRFEQKAQSVRDSWRAYVLQRIGFIALLGIGLAVEFVVTFHLLLPRYQSGALSIGDIVLFNLLLLQLNMPFEMIARSIDDVARSWSMLGPLSTLWAAPEEQQVADAQRFAGESGRLEFEQVSHRYGNRRGVSNVSFKAERGSINFLMGPTGAGKSTLLKLALKSIDPQHGRILVDGVDLSRIDRAAWHAAVAVVPQDVILLNESLADNILLGRARDDHRLRHAAGKAAILPLIEALPEGLETTVGERGLKLSGGERQRIAIARALYGEPGILFLDEASSALDEATEREIMGHIRALANDVTVVAITHRRSIVSPTDRVIELESDR